MPIHEIQLDLQFVTAPFVIIVQKRHEFTL
jgi:hypothetical protein